MNVGLGKAALDKPLCGLGRQYKYGFEITFFGAFFDMRQNALQIGGTESTPILIDTTLPAHRMETTRARMALDSPMGSGAGRCKGLV